MRRPVIVLLPALSGCFLPVARVRTGTNLCEDNGIIFGKSSLTDEAGGYRAILHTGKSRAGKPSEFRASHCGDFRRHAEIPAVTSPRRQQRPRLFGITPLIRGD